MLDLHPLYVGKEFLHLGRASGVASLHVIVSREMVVWQEVGDFFLPIEYVVVSIEDRWLNPIVGFSTAIDMPLCTTDNLISCNASKILLGEFMATRIGDMIPP